MIPRITGLLVLLIVCAVYCEAAIHVISQSTAGSSIRKSLTNVCQVKVNCQMLLTNSASRVFLGGTSICKSFSSSGQIVTVGSGTDIPLSLQMETGDYFRAIVTEIPNSCSGTTNRPTTTGINHKIDQLTTGNSITVSANVCKVNVNCQLLLSNAASSVTLGGISICKNPTYAVQTVTVGSGSIIPLSVQVQTGDYFRAIITEVPNSCTGATTKKPTTGINHKINQLTTGNSITVSANVCKVKVNCQLQLFNPESSVTLGGISICKNPTYAEQTVTVGRGGIIPLSVRVQSNDYFRAIITEIPNSCTTTTNKPITGSTHTIDESTSGSGITKSFTNVCKVMVNCQLLLSNGASSVTLGGTPICKPPTAAQRIVTVGSGSVMPFSGKVQPGDYFRAVITEIPNSCTTTTDRPITTNSQCTTNIGELSGVIQSPDFPTPYEANKKCTYTFEAKPGYCGVTINFKTFELQSSSACKADNLKFDSKIFCGTDLSNKKMSLRLPSTVTFTSNEDLTIGKGFLGYFKYTETCNEVCNKKENTISGYITPPAGTYNNNLFCKFELEKNGDSRCAEFTIHKMKNLKPLGDYVKIGAMKYEYKVIIDEPIKVKVAFPEDGRPINVDFVSNNAESTDLPFLISYVQLSGAQCPERRCQHVITEKVGRLKSPEDTLSTKNPKPYPKDFLCQYIIKKAGDHKAAILALENKLGSGDTLKVTKGSPLGELASNKNTRVEFDGNEIIVEFKSDGQDETAFNVLVLQST